MDRPRPLSRLILWMLFFFPFFGGHNIYGHCAITFLWDFSYFSSTGKHKGCSSISLYSTRKKSKTCKNVICSFFPREPHRLLDGCNFLPTTDLQKGHLFFNRKKYICDYNLLFVCFSHSLHFLDFFFLFRLPESKRTLVRICTDFHWTHRTQRNKHWSIEKPYT